MSSPNEITSAGITPIPEDKRPHNKFNSVTGTIQDYNGIIIFLGKIAIVGATICGIAAICGIVAMIWTEFVWISQFAQYISHFGTVLCAIAAVAPLYYLIDFEIRKMVPPPPDTNTDTSVKIDQMERDITILQEKVEDIEQRL